MFSSAWLVSDPVQKLTGAKETVNFDMKDHVKTICKESIGNHGIMDDMPGFNIICVVFVIVNCNFSLFKVHFVPSPGGQVCVYISTTRVAGIVDCHFHSGSRSRQTQLMPVPVSQFNSLWSSDDIWQDRSDGTKPLLEPMLTSHYWSHVVFTREQFHRVTKLLVCVICLKIIFL